MDQDVISLSQRRAESLQRLQDAFQSIYDRYNQPFQDTDIVDLMDLRIVCDRGALRSLRSRPLGNSLRAPKPPKIFQEAPITNVLHNMQRTRQRLLSSRALSQDQALESDTATADPTIIHADLETRDGKQHSGIIESFFGSIDDLASLSLETLYHQWTEYQSNSDRTLSSHALDDVSDQEAIDALNNSIYYLS